MDPVPRTPPSLLDGLRQPDNAAALQRFAELYADLLLLWIRRWPFAREDAEEMTQEVLVHLFRVLRRYERQDGVPFRCWLYRVTRNRCIDYRRRNRPLGEAAQLAEIPDEAAGTDEVDAAEYLEWIVHRARGQLREKFTDRTWTAFLETRVKGRPVQEVAGELQMKPAAGYDAVYKVLAALRHHLEGFLD